MVNGFAPATLASDFDIDGHANLDQVPVGISDRAPERAVNHYTDSRVVARESEYLCAQMVSHITAVRNKEIVDFESVVVFDVHVTPGEPDVLLRRTVVAYVTVIFYCRYF